MVEVAIDLFWSINGDKKCPRLAHTRDLLKAFPETSAPDISS